MAEKKKINFEPAKGVTLANSIQYIAAIEKAAFDEIMELDIDQRAYTLFVLKAALKSAVMTIDNLTGQLLVKGEALPINDTQQQHFQSMLDIASGKKQS